MTESLTEQTLERLRRVENRQRRANVIGACGALMLLASMSGGPQDTVFRRDVIEVGELRVVHDGATRIRLGVDAGGTASVVILDPSGTRRAALTAAPGAPAQIELFDAVGEPQPLIRQVATEAGELGREAIRDIQRDLEAAIGPEIDRLRDALSAWREQLGDPTGPDAARPDTGRPEAARLDAPGVARPGVLAMRIVAEPGDPGVDLDGERRRLRAWLAAHPEASRDPAVIQRFNALASGDGGPIGDAVRWFPHLIRGSHGDPQRWDIALGRHGVDSVVAAYDEQDWNDGRVAAGRDTLIEYVPLRMVGESFSGADIDPEQIKVGLDSFGNPALTYAMRADRQQAFADWSEANVGRFAAIVIDGRVDSAPRFISRIAGRAQITGRFSRDEVAELARRLRAVRR